MSSEWLISQYLRSVVLSMIVGGRLVYNWTDPGKGWDGNIGGTKAS